jgi:hypothetical protein
MATYRIIVGNIGECWTGSNPVQAQKQYGEWIAASKAEHGRASGETVTLIRETHDSYATLREFDPNAGFFAVEVTDTFGGDANYCWVRRYKIRATTTRGAIGKTPAWGNGWRADYNDGETARYNASGAAVCAFVSRFDPEAHAADYTEVL